MRNADPEVILDVLYAPLYYRLLVGHQTLTPKFVREYLDLAMHGVLSENVKLDAVRAKKPAKPPKKGQDTKAPAARAGTRSS